MRPTLTAIPTDEINLEVVVEAEEAKAEAGMVAVAAEAVAMVTTVTTMIKIANGNDTIPATIWMVPRFPDDTTRQLNISY